MLKGLRCTYSYRKHSTDHRQRDERCRCCLCRRAPSILQQLGRVAHTPRARLRLSGTWFAARSAPNHRGGCGQQSPIRLAQVIWTALLLL